MLTISIFGWLLATGAPLRNPPSLPSGVTQQMVDHGKALFHGAGKCFGCHGQDGTGTPRGPDLTSRQWLDIHGEYGEIVRLITRGVPKPKKFPKPMPPNGGSKMSADEVRAVAAYVWSISH